MTALWAGIAEGFAARPTAPDRSEIESAWRSLLSSSHLTAALTRMSLSIERANGTYFRSVLKTTPPRPDPTYAREVWIAENVSLWNKLGDELADRLLEVLRAVRVDAKGFKLTPAQRAELERLRSGARHEGHNAVTNVQRALEKKGLVREGRYGTELTEAGHAALAGTAAPEVAALSPVDQARKMNIELIKGLEPEQRAGLTKLLKAGQEQGVRHETLIESVQDVTGFGESRARLIARDQTVKHNAAVLEAQAKGAGITRYRWVTVKDEATRPMHKKLDGQTFSFDDPPVTNKQGDRNNPGHDYNCRCSAMVIIDLFAGLSDE
jgi:SPP1 gp7 family putative phage head morphogenesis protein